MHVHTHTHTQGHFIKCWFVVSGIWSTMPQAETFSIPFLLFLVHCGILSLLHLAWLICELPLLTVWYFWPPLFVGFHFLPYFQRFSKNTSFQAHHQSRTSLWKPPDSFCQINREKETPPEIFPLHEAVAFSMCSFFSLDFL